MFLEDIKKDTKYFFKSATIPGFERIVTVAFKDDGEILIDRSHTRTDGLQLKILLLVPDGKSYGFPVVAKQENLDSKLKVAELSILN